MVGVWSVERWEFCRILVRGLEICQHADELPSLENSQGFVSMLPVRIDQVVDLTE